MKVKNYHVYGTVEKINDLYDDYTFLGREAAVIEPGHLVVYALPQRKRKEREEAEAAAKAKTSRKNTYRASK